MTKEAAIRMMYRGRKITHRYFSPGEWMTMQNGMIVLEDGVICSPQEFWKQRTDPVRDDGYEIVND